METVGFTRMIDGTPGDYALLDRAGRAYVDALPDRIMAVLESMRHAFPGYQVTSLDHLLQTATRAERGGAEEEMVAAALLHDIGDVLAPHNHAEYGAAVLRPYVSARTHWVMLHHGIFQYYNTPSLGPERRAMREQYRGHEHFEACANFCDQWDQTSFDPDYDTAPLPHFEPMLRRVLARPPWDSASGSMT